MLEITLNWKPDPQTLTQLVQVALQEQKSLESLLDEAIAQYLQANLTVSASPETPDPFIGLYEGSPNLSTEAEAILRAEVTSTSGLSWKK
ncbi:MAG: hypothetical protein SVX43_02155 [Cyanobacteriota bacterium]|nr:hypothetical protein [Cyanobacteriota bacterium]